ncbi:ParB/Srx family N-terminal domain-containing protein [Escherichia coli]|uniref:ParB/Srx family N-terminal domain-containing protein n=1 Tax=Escherichia TaxID=561 RepID=UPI000B49AC52|nr:ParB/Srx family N-terminal domain-containing protein [Escherichia coli]AUY77750.1 hypothetical protein BWI83_21295 [Escherichia coli]EEZ6055958.1 ParB N-terminal domain-containing protein [Escherichia coli]EEZ6093675.1 ParB N-terminal domain-containing protein [Escherichia coli]MCU6830442.1 ParB/Srx family N-terminal domain-containing protein [Escherichia coli]MQI44636.1 hypothetical protein [Escherichia coli]
MSEKLKIVYRPLQELSPYAHNARTHSPEQVAQLVESIKQFGWTNPVLIDEKGEIIAGHGRVMAAEMLKMDSVPVIVLSGLTDEQKKAYRLADNRLPMNAGWDEDLLRMELSDLINADFDVSLTGFIPTEIDELLTDVLPGSGVYDADISGASTLILHFNMNAGSCPAVQFRVNYRNGGIFYRSARDGYGFEANWSEFYTTTRKPSAGDVGAYTQAECNSRFITGIRLGGLSSVQTWKGPGWSDRSGYVVTGSVNGNRDELIDTTQARPIQYCINGTWYNAGSI